jgi:hypothetical protein
VQVLEAEQAEAAEAQRKFPEFGPGDVLQLKLVCLSCALHWKCFAMLRLTDEDWHGAEHPRK